MISGAATTNRRRLSSRREVVQIWIGFVGLKFFDLKKRFNRFFCLKF
jgi:hypothetical protein